MRDVTSFVIAEILGRGVYRLAIPTGTQVKTTANSRDLKAFTGDGYGSRKKTTGAQD